MTLLKEAGAEYTYREYTLEPLSAAEITDVLAKLELRPRQVLRKNDKAYKALQWTGEERDEELIARMAAHPTLLQRPIAIKGSRAVLGRPAESILDLVS